MNCEQADETLGAYALDALSPEEMRDVRAHLETCRKHDEALAGMQAVASSLPLATPERAPAAGLRGRLLDAFDAEASTAAPRGIETARAGVRWSLPRLQFVYAAAAALVLAVAGLLSWNLALQFGGDDGGPQTTVTVEFSAEIGSGRVVYVPEERAGIMELDLQEPAAGRTYQAWALYESGPVSLGTMSRQGIAAFQADLSDASAVAITEEPEGGSDQPTGEPLVVAELS